jgi:hypothetical protein
MSKFINVGNEAIPFFSENENHFIPIKPFCEVLGIAHQSQQETIKNNPIYGSTVTHRVIVAADDKER